MKRLVLLSALVIAVGAVLLELIRTDTGYVLIAVGTTTIETSFWVAVAALLAVALVIWLIFAAIGAVRHGLSGGLGLAAKRSRRAEQRTSSGLIYFVEGNWRAAKKDLLKAARHASNPLVHYLAAARCSFELGDPEESRKWLHKAERAAPDNELAVTLTQARIQLLDSKYEQCLATLKRARELAPRHPTVLDLLRQVYGHLHDWESLQLLLPELRKQKLYKEEELERLEQNVALALLSASGKRAVTAASKHTQTATESAEKLLADTWQGLPKKARTQSPVVALYGKLLINIGAHAQAENLLRRHLIDHWNSELISLYGMAAAPSAKDQLATGERWLRDHPADADLLLALGRISLRNELWGKARDYFEQSLKINPQPDAYAELARLLAYLGQHQKSTQLYQQGLLNTTHGLPALPMPGNADAHSMKWNGALEEDGKEGETEETNALPHIGR